MIARAAAPARARRALLAAGLLVLALTAAAIIWRASGSRPPVVVSRTQVDGAVQRGLEYLRHDRSDLSARIVLDYLQRRYGLDADLALTASERDGSHPQGLGERRGTWARFLGDEQGFDVRLLPGALTSASSVEDVVTRAVYCDRAPLPAAFVPILGAFSLRGDYELTHAPLALKLARDNGCTIDETAALALERSLRERLGALVVRAAVDPRFDALDVRYEALAVLEDFLGAPDAVPSGVSRVLAEQQADGGWKPAADQRSAAHPTVLAIWALLAWRRPDVRAVPLAHVPPAR